MPSRPRSLTNATRLVVVRAYNRNALSDYSTIPPRLVEPADAWLELTRRMTWHQQCLARVAMWAETDNLATREAARFPRQVLDLVQRALAWRDRLTSDWPRNWTRSWSVTDKVCR